MMGQARPGCDGWSGTRPGLGALQSPCRSQGPGPNLLPNGGGGCGGGGRLGLEVSIAALGVAWNGTFLLLPSPQLGESLGPALGLW